MAQHSIISNITWGDIRDRLNNNILDVEERIQDLEGHNFLRSGSSAPSVGDFNEGDFYVMKSGQWPLYQKINGAWVFQVNMIGPIGLTGARGLNHKGTWVNTTAYVTDDAVAYRSGYWRAKVNNIGVEPTTGNTTEWELISAGTNSMGLWSSGTVYRVNDIVTHNGSSYVALTNHTAAAGTTPGTAPATWQIRVQKGDVGDPGPSGPGVPTGGTANQILTKTGSADFATAWQAPKAAMTMLYKTATQAITMGAGNTQINFNAKLYDRGNAGAPGQNAIVIPAGFNGVWNFHVELAFELLSESISYWFNGLLVKDGVIFEAERHKVPSGRSGNATVHIHASAEVAAGDVITAQVNFVGAYNSAGQIPGSASVTLMETAAGTIFEGRWLAA